MGHLAHFLGIHVAAACEMQPHYSSTHANFPCGLELSNRFSAFEERHTGRTQRADLVCISRARNFAVNAAGWDVQVGLMQRTARGCATYLRARSQGPA